MRQAKTKDQILKANLNKSLNKLKTKVADREELWLDMFTDILTQTLTYYYEHDRQGTLKDHVAEASDITDLALNAYEERWGKG